MVPDSDTHHVVRGSIPEYGGDFSLLESARRFVERRHEVADADRLDRATVDECSRRKAFIQHPQLHLGEPRVILGQTNQRVDACHGSTRRRAHVVSPEPLHVLGTTRLGYGARADDAMPHSLTGEGETDLRDQFLTVRDSTYGAGYLTDDVRE
jgi:hypothetical protein